MYTFRTRIRCNDETLNQRFFSRIDKTETCWLWKGGKTPVGYGMIARRQNPIKWMYAHRLSYKIHFGDFDEKLQVCHKCDNPPCVNPEHLFLGTAKDNALDCSRKGRRPKINPLGFFQRSKTHCKYGHEFNEKNTAYYYENKTYRSCKQCANERSKKAYSLKRSKLAKL